MTLCFLQVTGSAIFSAMRRGRGRARDACGVTPGHTAVLTCRKEKKKRKKKTTPFDVSLMTSQVSYKAAQVLTCMS